MKDGPTLDDVPIAWALDLRAKGDAVLSESRPDFPVLRALGLYRALAELEAVCAASGGLDRVTWPTKTIDRHLEKLEGHLDQWRAGDRVDRDSGRSALFHVASRALMAAGVELGDSDDGGS